MNTVKRIVIVIIMGLIVLSVDTIVYGQSTKAKTEISNDRLIKELQAQIEQLQVVIRKQEAEIQRLKDLCKEVGIDPEPKAEKEKVVMPKYSVLDEDVYDAPIKAQVELNILVSGEISESGLRALLNELYTSTKAKKGFKYHGSPTNIYIYAFTSKERFESGMGQWIAMLQQSPGDAKPRIDIKKRQIDQLGAKPETKFGLSEAKRKQIFYELVKAGDDATKLAIQKYPNDIMKQIDYENKTWEANEEKVRRKYKITEQQIDKIKVEGAIIKDWPMPKL